MMKNVSITFLLSVLFHVILLFPSSIKSQPTTVIRHNNTKCSKATIIPSNVTLPYFDNPTNAFALAELTRAPTNVFANCSEHFDNTIQFAWYQWTPSNSGFYDINATSVRFPSLRFNDYRVSVIQGRTCGTLNTSMFVVCPNRQTQRSIYLEKRIKYYFLIYSGSSGDILDFTIQRTSPPPSNDECYNAIRIPSSLTLPYTTSEIDVSGATINRNSELIPTCDRNYNIDRRTVQRFGTLASYWYVWTPSRSGYYKLDVTYNTTICDPVTCSLFSFPTIAVYENGISFDCNQTSTWKQVACTGNGVIASITEYMAGKTYYVQIFRPINVDFSKQKYAMLTIQRAQAPPVNDFCVNAIPIDPKNGLNVTNIDTTYASADTDVYFGSFSPVTRNGIWYKYNETIGLPRIALNFCSNARLTLPRAMYIYLLTGNNDCTSLQIYYDYFTTSASRCPSNFDLDLILLRQNITYYILIQDAPRIPLQISFIKNYFKMINSVTDKAISYTLPSITSYAARGLYLTSSKLNIEAYFHPEYGVNSVDVTFDNPFRSRCERIYPFSIFGDRNGNFYNATIPIGSHYVTATPYTGSDCNGTIPTSPLTQNFTVSGCSIELSLYRYRGFNLGFLTHLTDNIKVPSIPCNSVTFVGSPYCMFRYENIQLRIFDAISNMSITGEVVMDSRGDNIFYFGPRNSSEPIGVNSINLPPGRKYVALVTIDNIEHPPRRFTIQNACTP